MQINQKLKLLEADKQSLLEINKSLTCENSEYHSITEK